MAPPVRAAYPADEAGRGNMEYRRIKLAPYLSGALWRLRADGRTFILYNSLPIARRDGNAEGWAVIAPNWKVTNTTFRKVRVQYSGSIGVVVSLA
jgi:hypothetical protein